MLYLILFIIVLVTIYTYINKVPAEFKNVPRVSLWSMFRSITSGKTVQEHYCEVIEPVMKERGYALVLNRGKWSFTTARPEIIKQVFRKTQDFTKYVKRHPKSLEIYWTGQENIVRSDSDSWRRFRRPANPIFHQTFDPKNFAECIKSTIDLIMYRINEHGSSPFPITDINEYVTLDILGVGIMGYDFMAIKKQNESRYNYLYHSAFNGLANPLYFMFPWLDNFKFGNRVNQFADAKEFKEFILEIVNNRRKEIKAGKNVSKDLLTTMLAEDPDSPFEPLSDVELVENLIVFFIAGHDTTANTLSYAMYHLAKNPEIQEKLRTEIYSVLNIPKDHEQLVVPSADQLKEMEYLNCVIKEVMRISPAVIQIPRIVQEDFTIPNDNIVIPSGTLLSMSVYGAHHDPKTYPNPHKFEPERFLNGKYDTDIYLPFGGGSRMCIGMNFSLMEQRVYLAMLLQKFVIEIKENNPDFNNLRMVGMALTKAKDLRLNFSPRF